MITTIEPEIDDEGTNSSGGQVETAEATRPRSYAAEDDDLPISPDDPPDPPWSRKELEECLPLRSSDPDKETWESITGRRREAFASKGGRPKERGSTMQRVIYDLVSTCATRPAQISGLALDQAILDATASQKALVCACIDSKMLALVEPTRRQCLLITGANANYLARVPRLSQDQREAVALGLYGLTKAADPPWLAVARYELELAAARLALAYGGHHKNGNAIARVNGGARPHAANGGVRRGAANGNGRHHAST